AIGYLAPQPSVSSYAYDHVCIFVIPVDCILSNLNLDPIGGFKGGSEVSVKLTPYQLGTYSI
ncbi:MAG: hypothetical protein MJE68_00790, partial [Proteobacteria bacterium]|nr:hypothetical protein [Pseudomonadota bacterium]